MREDVEQALEVSSDSPMGQRIVDITTTGRRSGEQRRIETVFRTFEGSVYLTGIPGPKPRAWLLNLEAEPRFKFHLKNEVVADLDATADVISDNDERKRVLTVFVEEFNRQRDPDGPYPVGVLQDWLDRSPLAKISFDEA